jgi:HAD superfamily hydrolase (TIGR01509 family)
MEKQSLRLTPGWGQSSDPSRRGSRHPCVEAILFDAEGVVVDTEPAWDRGQAELLRRRGLPYDREAIKPLLTGRSLAEGTALLRERYGLDDSVEALVRERAELVRTAFAEEVGLMPGFREFFECVSGLFPLALATSLDPELLALMDRRLGLTDLFSGHVYSLAREGLRAKPHPDLFLEAAGGLGVEPGRCLVIEDAPNGVEAARRAGMRCFGLATTHATEKLRMADRIFDGFADIPLDRLGN